MKKLLAFALGLGLLFLLAACGGANEPGVTTIIVGTSNDYPPYCYLDANGDLVGYEKALLDAVDARLPQYKFKYEIFDFKSLLTALDTGRCDIAAHQYGKNEAREQKYQFGTVPYFQSQDFIVVKQGRGDIQSLDDLGGKIASIAPASLWAELLEGYNREHPENPIAIKYYESTPQILSADLQSGVIDATLLTEADLLLMNTFLGTKFEKVGQPLSSTETYHVYRKDSAALQQAVDGILEELRQSGELERLQQKAVNDVLGLK
jgi:L-cystine transport system substrate-binding protein